MADWNAIRKRAQAINRRLRDSHLPDGDFLPSTDQILRAAEAETELECIPVNRNDPLLGGAFALLDRKWQNLIYTQEGFSPERIRFIIAHEFAHFWLHPEATHDLEMGEDSPETYLGEELEPTAKQVESGYSPTERREKEANIFASELLLPTDSLRAAYLNSGWNAKQIARHTGLSETLVLTQLQRAILLPSEPKTESLADSKSCDPPHSPKPFPLDPSQLAAATIEMGPVLVDAGPGTGKTKTLISRILHLLQTKKTPPEQVLALTFSNKAAGEMQSRLQEEAGELANRVWIGTFHAFGLEVLRKEGYRIGLSNRPQLIDAADAIDLLLQHYNQLNLKEYEYLARPTLPFADILACISRAKDELKTPQEYLTVAQSLLDSAETDEAKIQARKAAEAAGVYVVYEKLLKDRGQLDFGDLLFRAVRLFEEFPEARREWQAKYPQILADEYQDINRASARLLQCIAGEGKGFWAVGDLRQAIYRFRGASPANIRMFESDFPGGKRLQLKRNYRSLPELVSLFSGVASKLDGEPMLWEANRGDVSPLTPDSEMRPLTPDSGGTQASSSYHHSHTPSLPHPPAPLQVVEAEDRGAQSDWICGRILQNRENGIALNSHAILVPTNRHASELAEELLLRGIPAQHLGYLFERSEVKDLLALLSLCCDREGTGVWRVATFPEFAIPRSDVSYLLKSANAEGRWSLLFLSKAGALPNLSEEGKAGVANLWKTLEKLAYLDDPWQILTRFLFDASNYLKPFLVEARPLTPDSGGTQASSSHPHSHTPSLPHPLTGVKSDIRSTQSLLAIFQLLTFVQELSNRVRSRRSSDPQGSFKSEFMARLRFLFECKQAKAPRLPDEVDQLDAVRIMTIHQSKGLEFPVVFLPNLVKGQFPTRNTGRMATLPPGLLNEARPLTPDSGGIQASSSHYHSLSPTLPHPKSGGVERESDDDENEEEDNSRRLFFVALTRARDSLSLIRPLKWKEKPEPASPRLTEIGNLLEGLGCLALGVGALESFDTLANAETPNIQNQTLNAKYLDVNIQTPNVETPNVETPNAEAPNTKTPNAPLSHSAIKLYMQCPRRYFYRYVERLPAIGEASNYLDFYTILNETLSRIRELASTGIKPESGEIQALFDAKWGESEEGENGHREALRQRAHSLISDAISEEAPAGGTQVSNLFRAEFPAGAIEVRADRAEILDDGTLLLTKEKLRGVKKDDHTSIELALLRRAARAREPGRKVVIALHYLPEAKTTEAPEKPKLEEKRVAKYELALESLASGDFTPSPSDDCPACPYYLICTPEPNELNFSG